MVRSFMLALVVYVAWTESKEWDWFRLSADSGGYVTRWSPDSIRGPLYPLFVSLTQMGRGFTHDTIPYQLGIYRDRPDAPLVRTVRAQKIVHAVAFLFLSWACLIQLAPAPAALFLAGLRGMGIVGQWNSHVLAECLSEAWLCVLLALLLQYSRNRGGRRALLMGAVVGLAYLTRPANVYMSTFLLLPAFMAYRSARGWGRFSGLKALALALVIALSVQAITAFLTGRFEASGISAYLDIGPALQVAEPGDIAVLDEGLERRFFEYAMSMRTATLAENEQLRGLPVWDQMNMNRWAIAGRVLAEMQLSDRQGRKVLASVSRKVMKQHRIALLGIAGENFLVCFARSRTWMMPWVFVSVVLGCWLALYARGGVAAAGLTMWLSRLVAFSVFAFCQPAYRYIWPTEMLTLLGGFLIVHEAVVRLRSRPVLRDHTDFTD